MRAPRARVEGRMKSRRKRAIPNAVAAVILLGCALGYAAHSPPQAHNAAPSITTLRAGYLSCGPAALLAVARVRDVQTALQLREILVRDDSAARGVSSFYDLASWARHVGLDPIGLKVNPHELHRLPLPAVAHVKPDHFLALMEVDDERVVVIDQGAVTREIPRREFDRHFSGHVLSVGTGHTSWGQSF